MILAPATLRRANSRHPPSASWRSPGGRFGRRCASLAGSHRRNLAKKKRMQRGEATTLPPLARGGQRRQRGSGCRGECHECKRRILRDADPGLSQDGLHCELQFRTGNRSRSLSACGAECAGEIPTHTTYPLPSHTHCARSNWRGLVRGETSRSLSSGDFRNPEASRDVACSRGERFPAIGRRCRRRPLARRRCGAERATRPPVRTPLVRWHPAPWPGTRAASLPRGSRPACPTRAARSTHSP
jgi:hypothetical protein